MLFNRFNRMKFKRTINPLMVFLMALIILIAPGNYVTANADETQDAEETPAEDLAPEVHLYVNNNVTAELDTFDQGFQYEILAYIPKDGGVLILNDQLPEFIKSRGKEGVHVFDMGETPKEAKQVEAESEESKQEETESEETKPVENASEETNNNAVMEEILSREGTEIEIDSPDFAYIKSGKLSVGLYNLVDRKLQGHWVKVVFEANLNSDNYDDIASYLNKKKESQSGTAEDVEDQWINVSNNGPVISDLVHDGIPNSVTYSLYDEYWALSEYKSNVATVKPGLVNTTVEKKWMTLDGSNAWPENVESVVLKVKYGEDEEEITLTKDESKKETKYFKKLSGANFQIEEITAVEGFVAAGAFGDMNMGYVVTNKENGVEPGNIAIETYVEKEVHKNIVEFDKVFQYDSIAYVPMDATAIVIKDNLSEKLHYVSDDKEIAGTAVVLGLDEDPLTAAGTKVSANATIDGQNLSVRIDNIGVGQGQQNINGKKVRVSIRAQINESIRTMEALELGDPEAEDSKDADTESQNSEAKDAEPQKGVKNSASYSIELTEEGHTRNEYKDIKSNEVTVIPETENFIITVNWERKRGTEEELKKALKLERMTDGVAVELAEQPVPKISGKDTNTWTIEWPNLPKLENVVYQVREDYIKGFAVNGSPALNEEKILVIEDVPEIELYVNKDVHQDIVEFDRPFEYTIIAHVPYDAKSIIITDTLDRNLEFVSYPGDIAARAVVIDPSDHISNTGSVVDEGKHISPTVSINKNQITVRVDNIGQEEGQLDIAGKSIRIGFTAKISDSVRDINALSKSTIIKDGDIISDLNLDSGNRAGHHSGIVNYATYTIGIDAAGTTKPEYKNVKSNEVTVFPETEDVVIKSVWAGDDEKIRPTESAFKVALRLLKVGDTISSATSSRDVTVDYISRLSIQDNGDDTWTATWKALPKLMGVNYRVAETVLPGYEASGSPALNGGTITNTRIQEEPTEEAPTTEEKPEE